MNNLLDYLKVKLHSSHYSIKQILYSFGLAVISWLVISMTLYPNLSKKFDNVELSIDLEETSAEINDLTLISQNIDTVNVNISDNRTKIGNLKKEDCIAYAVIENVVQSGIYELAIKVKTKDNEILNAEVSPSTVTVEFDKYASKEVPIEVSAPNIIAKEGYIIDEKSPTTNPQTIKITGPKKQVDSISKFVVNINQNKELDNYYTYHSTNTEEWSIFDENGSEINNKGLKFESSDIQVDFLAYMTKNLKLKYNIINAPFDNFTPNFELSTQNIMVCSTDSSLENTDEFNIGDIDMREVDLDFSKTFDITLPSTYKNISGVEQVTVSLNSEEYEKREFYNLTNFNLVNAPSNYDITLVTTNLNLTLIGSPEDITTINETDINLKVDLTNIQTNNSIVSAPLIVEIPDFPNVWWVGKQTIFLDVKEKSVVTEAITSTNISTSNITNATS